MAPVLLNPSRFGGGGGSAYDAAVLADAPLGYWKFDETSGTSALDSSGNSRTLTITGNVTLGAAAVMPSGSASYDFRGAGTNDSYLIRANESWMNVASFAVTAWIRPDAVTSYRGIWSKDGGTRGPSFYVKDGKLDLNNGAADFTGTSTLSTATAYFAAMTYDSSSSTLKLYINGSLDKTTTSVSANNTTTNAFVVGASKAGGASLALPFDGRMSHLAYFGSALSDSQIAAHFAAA